MRPIIISNYKGTPIKQYIGSWKQAFKQALDVLLLSAERDEAFEWGELAKELSDKFEEVPVTNSSVTPSSKSSTTSSLSYQKRLTFADFNVIKDNHKKIKNYWELQMTGRNVEEVLFNAARDFVVVQ